MPAETLSRERAMTLGSDEWLFDSLGIDAIDSAPTAGDLVELEGQRPEGYLTSRVTGELPVQDRIIQFGRSALRLEYDPVIETYLVSLEGKGWLEVDGYRVDREGVLYPGSRVRFGAYELTYWEKSNKPTSFDTTIRSIITHITNPTVSVSSASLLLMSPKKPLAFAA